MSEIMPLSPERFTSAFPIGPETHQEPLQQPQHQVVRGEATVVSDVIIGPMVGSGVGSEGASYYTGLELTGQNPTKRITNQLPSATGEKGDHLRGALALPVAIGMGACLSLVTAPNMARGRGRADSRFGSWLRKRQEKWLQRVDGGKSMRGSSYKKGSFWRDGQLVVNHSSGVVWAELLIRATGGSLEGVRDRVRQEGMTPNERTEYDAQQALGEQMAADTIAQNRLKVPETKKKYVTLVNASEAHQKNPNLSRREATLAAYFEQMGLDINNVHRDLVRAVSAYIDAPEQMYDYSRKAAGGGHPQSERYKGIEKQFEYAVYGSGAGSTRNDFEKLPSEYELRGMFLQFRTATGRDTGKAPEVLEIEADKDYVSVEDMIVANIPGITNQLVQIYARTGRAFTAQNKLSDPRFLNWAKATIIGNSTARQRPYRGRLLSVGARVLFPSMQEVDGFLKTI